MKIDRHLCSDPKAEGRSGDYLGEFSHAQKAIKGTLRLAPKNVSKLANAHWKGRRNKFLQTVTKNILAARELFLSASFALMTFIIG